jgi:hypothetical protein
MPLDRGLAATTGLRECQLEPLQPLLVPAHPGLRDAVEERQRRRFADLGPLAAREELDDGRMMAGSGEFPSFIDDRSDGF